MSPDAAKWFVIVNPVAGGGRGLDHFPQISKHLRDAHIVCEPVFTEHKFHATELTVTAVKDGFRHIIVVGGDGTLHEVVNGLFIQREVRPDEVLLAVMAVGTENSWARTFGGFPANCHQAVQAICEGYSFLQDVGVVTYEEAQYRQSRYMANVAGAGFDAYVVRRVTHLKKQGYTSRWRHIRCLVNSFFRYKSTGMKVWVDERLVYNNLLFSIAVGVCKYSGGMQKLPEAIADDNMLDLTLVRPIHFWHILFRFRYLVNGGIYRIGHVMQERGRRIRIESSPEISVEVDGELLGETPLEFSILHRAVRIVVGREFYERQASAGGDQGDQ